VKRTTKIAAALLTLGLGITCGTVAASATGQLFSVSDADQDRPIASYEVNRSGDSFGSLSQASVDEDAPDLIAAIGTKGERGYVRSSDLILPLPKSPTEALQRQAEVPKARTLALYDKDGKTKIGEYMSGIAAKVQESRD
jgi:hypothetical protein